MSVNDYKKAISLLNDNNIKIFAPGGVSTGVVEALEKRLKVTLPPSYKMMLFDYGILGFEGQQIYGIGKSGLDGKSAPSVVFTTERARTDGEIDYSMIRLMASGYGPYYVMNCSQKNVYGECPIYEVHEEGIQHGCTRMADSFGKFLLEQVNKLFV